MITDQGHFFTGMRTHAGAVGGGQALDMLTTADGRPGWATLFLRDGYAVDRPGLGRSPYHRDLYGAQGPAATYEGFVASFAGPAPDGLPPHTQWPGDGTRRDPALATFLAWQEPFPGDLVRAHEDMLAGAVGLLERIGPSVLLTHSLGAGFGWLALSECPSLVKAVVAVEPASFSHWLTPVPLVFGPADYEGKIGRVPIAVVTAESSGHGAADHATAEFLRSCGAAEIAALITDWIVKHT